MERIFGEKTEQDPFQLERKVNAHRWLLATDCFEQEYLGRAFEWRMASVHLVDQHLEPYRDRSAARYRGCLAPRVHQSVGLPCPETLAR